MIRSKIGAIRFSAFVGMLLLLFSVTGCATLGTKTVYLSPKTAPLHTLGFANPQYGPGFAEVIREADEIFGSTVIESLGDYRLSGVKRIATELPFDNPDPAMIAKACTVNEIDALVLTRLRLAGRSLPVGYGHLDTIDTEAEMELFSASGQLVVSVTHDTWWGNSYLWIPSPERTLRDATRGALKRIAQEIKLTSKR